MATKPNITADHQLGWDDFKDKNPEEALPLIYAHVESTSRKMCNWYWDSISEKKPASLRVRRIAVFLLIVGAILHFATAMGFEPQDALRIAQSSVAILVIAGLLLMADRIFGWSSGWMRYVATVTTMENLTRAFQMEWAKYLVSKTEPLNESDSKALFDLASGVERELSKLLEEETTRWVADFNTGIALLESLIKTQREETNKKLDSIRTLSLIHI